MADAGAPAVGLKLRVENEIPIGRGLGASAAARVAGLMLASALMARSKGQGDLWNADDILSRAAVAEGHPDNAAPCVRGGLSVAIVEGGRTHAIGVPLGSDLRLALFIPDQALSTERARAALPVSVTFSDATFNVGRATMLVAALATGDIDALAWATHDRLHEPARLRLIEGWADILDGARNAGAYGSFVSGAGSTTAAFCGPANAETVLAGMAEAAARVGIPGRTRVASIATRGASMAVLNA